MIGRLLHATTVAIVSVVLVCGAAATAAAQDDPAPDSLDPLRGPSAAAVADAPTPGTVDGITVAPERTARDKARWIPRVLLFVPRWTLWVVFQPLRAIAWAYERYQLGDRFTRFFFNDTETFGVYPVALFETGFGLNIGGRVVVRDMFGKGEDVKLRASYGGRFEQLYSASLATGQRLGRVELSLLAEFDIRPQDRFFGIGNEDLVDSPMNPIDPTIDATAVRSRFRQRVTTLSAGTDVRLVGDLGVQATTGVRYRSFAESGDLDDDPSVTDAYMESALVGFGPGLSATYSELELRYDTRRAGNPYLSKAAISTGWRLGAYAGYSIGFGDDESSFLRYGGDVQRYIDLYGGSRVLVLRLFLEGVTAGRDEVPFVELPRLGGGQLLRGYDQDRFRDRVATLASAEYQWDLMERASAFVFGDVGRVYESMADLGTSGHRLGFGGGLQLQSKNSFLLRMFLASSTDGGLFFNLSFDPVYDAWSRVRK